jgi:hypothetical protein
MKGPSEKPWTSPYRAGHRVKASGFEVIFTLALFAALVALGAILFGKLVAPLGLTPAGTLVLGFVSAIVLVWGSLAFVVLRG